MSASYATPAQLDEYLPSGVSIGDDEADTTRLLARASALIDRTVRAPFTIDDDGLPVDEPLAEALAEATCAQVEYWAEVGEEHDVAGMGGRQVSIAGLSMAELPPEVAPRTRRALENAGLLGPVPTSRLPYMATRGWP